MSFLKVTGSRSGIGLFCNSNNCKNYLSNKLLSFVPLDVIPCYFSVSLCDNFISCASKIIHKAKMAHSAQNETAKYNFSLGVLTPQAIPPAGIIVVEWKESVLF